MEKGSSGIIVRDQGLTPFKLGKNRTVVLLVILAFLGNYRGLPLFFGLDFLFGSIFVMLALHLFGISRGVVVAIPCSAYTHVLWNHPYAAVILIAEALVVGYVLHRRNEQLVLIDSLFWFVAGMPMVWFFYHVVLGTNQQLTLLIMLKQATNGIFNSLIAGLIVTYVPIGKALDFVHQQRTVSLGRTLFTTMTAVIFLPALVIMVINSRLGLKKIEADILLKTEQCSSEVSVTLHEFIERHLKGVKEVARQMAHSPSYDIADLQNKLDIVRRLFPDLHNIYAANALGTTVAFSPTINERGESNIGLNFADRPYYGELKSTLQPVLSDVFIGRGGVFSPIVTLSVPVLREGRFQGFALGAVNLTRFREKLLVITSGQPIHATVLDRSGIVVASTREDLKPLDRMDRIGGGEIRAVRDDFYQWLPPESGSATAVERWRKSYYVKETRIGAAIPWSLITEVSVLPYQTQLYQYYLISFTHMLALTVAAVIVSMILSRAMVSSLERLREVTTDLPGRISSQQTITWPESAILEIDSLIGNFRIMTASLMQYFVELNRANRALEFEIEDHRQTEKHVLDERERLSVTLQSIGDGVITTDVEGNVCMINNVGERLTGWANSEAQGKPLFDVLALTDAKRGRVNEMLSDSLTGATRVAGAMLLTSRDGTSRAAESSFSPIRDHTGMVIGAVIVFRDITEKQKMERELQKAQKLESVGLLAGGIAHDFNNILTVILGNVSLAKLQVPQGEMIYRRLEELERATMRARDLTQQLLTFSKGGAPVRKVVSIAELIRESCLFALRGSNVQCTFDIPEDLWPVNADESQLNQVLNNLVLNASQAMPDGGTITLTAQNVIVGEKESEPVESGRYVKITVHDQGPGIPEEHLQRVFDPYFTTKQSGSGLGLATAYSIIRQHDGQITVESEPGKGTSFFVYLPASSQAGVKGDQDVKGDKYLKVIRPGQGKILVMDDDDLVRQVAVHMLGHLGYEVQSVADGGAAIDAYKEAMETGYPFAAVIMDLTIPGGLGGKETIVKLRELDPEVRAIVSSGYSADPIMSNFRDHGFCGIITKPYTIEKLSAILGSIVSQDAS